MDNLLRLHFCRFYFQSWHRFPCTKVSRGWWQINLCLSLFHLASTLSIQLTLKLSLRLILESTPNFVSTLFCMCTQGQIFADISSITLFCISLSYDRKQPLAVWSRNFLLFKFTTGQCTLNWDDSLCSYLVCPLICSLLSLSVRLWRRKGSSRHIRLLFELSQAPPSSAGR